MLHEPPVKLSGWWTGIVSAACAFALTFLVVHLAAAFLPYVAVVRGAVGGAILASVAASFNDSGDGAQSPNDRG